MRFPENTSLAIALAATLAAVGCGGVQKQSFAPPAKAQAPALTVANKFAESSSATASAQNTSAASPAPAPQTKPAVPQALQADPAADLIARVEKEYQAGQDNYRAGHSEAAKQNFDAAFN